MARELTPEEQHELKNLHAVIENAIADGVLTEAERDSITATMRADGKITFEELEIIRQLVNEKVTSGELNTDYS